MSELRERAEQIRGRMAEIRRELDEDMEGVVSSARTMTDWHYYVRRYPWACLGISAAVGYLVVPSRLRVLVPDPRTLAKLAKQERLVVTTEPEEHARRGPTARLFDFVSTMAVRGLVAYLGHEAGRFFGRQAAEEQEKPPEQPRYGAPEHRWGS